MKLNFKTLLSTCLVSSLLLSGCSSTDSGTSSGGGTTDSGKVQIEYWHVNAATQGGTSVDQIVADFNAQSDTVEVTAKYNPDMYKGLMQNLQADVATGSSPAIVQIGWAFLDYFSNNFAYVTPDDAISRFDSDNSSYLSDNFLPNVLELALNSQGEQVGLPYSLSTPVLYINRDMLGEAGLSQEGPQTWEEVAEFAQGIKDSTGKYGLYIQEPSDFWAQQALIESNGGQVIELVDGQVKAAFASEEGIEAMELYAEMVGNGSALHISWDEGIQSFIDGSVGMLYTTIARRSQVDSGALFDVATVSSPSWEGKDAKVPAGGCMVVITAQSEEEIAAAWEFEQYLFSVSAVTEWTIGTGYVPPVVGMDTAEDGLKDFLAENEMMNAAVEQMDALVPWASFPGDAGLEAEQLLIDMRDQILGGQVSARDAMISTQEKINQLLG